MRHDFLKYFYNILSKKYLRLAILHIRWIKSLKYQVESSYSHLLCRDGLTMNYYAAS